MGYMLIINGNLKSGCCFGSYKKALIESVILQNQGKEVRIIPLGNSKLGFKDGEL